MAPTLRRILVVTLGICCSLALFVFAASSTAGPLPSATVVGPEDPPTTYYITDMGGHTLTAEVPPLGSPQLRVSNPRQGTVEATVMAVDVRTNQVSLQTREGQILVLNLWPEAVMGMRVGDQYTLAITQRWMQ